MFVSFWTASGERRNSEEPETQFETIWKIGDNVSLKTSQTHLFKSIENLVSSAICVAKAYAGSLNLVLELGLANGQTIIVRQYTHLPDIESNHSRRFHNEAKLMKWLGNHTRVPVPFVLAMPEATNDVPLPFMVMSKLPGGTIFDMLSRMDFMAKKNLVSSYVDFGIELFRLDVPQMIGSTVSDASGTLRVVPLVGMTPELCADRVFHSLEEYVKFLFTLKRKTPAMGTTDAEKTRAQQAVNDLETFVLQQMKALSQPELRRCVLAHDDLSHWNVLTDIDGTVTGVIDWEFHSIRPAVLAVGIPEWLSYSGPFDPRYAINTPQMEYLWLVSPKESQQLITHYYEVARNKDREYYDVLKKGEAIRTVAQWLKDPELDPGFDRMRAWLTEVGGKELSV